MTTVELLSKLFYEISPLHDNTHVKQQQFVKESLTRAFDELTQAQRGEKQLKTADEFIKELGL